MLKLSKFATQKKPKRQRKIQLFFFKVAKEQNSVQKCQNVAKSAQKSQNVHTQKNTQKIDVSA